MQVNTDTLEDCKHFQRGRSCNDVAAWCEPTVLLRAMFALKGERSEICKRFMIKRQPVQRTALGSPVACLQTHP